MNTEQELAELRSDLILQKGLVDEWKRVAESLQRWRAVQAPITWQDYRQQLFNMLSEHNFIALESEMNDLESLIIGYHAPDIEPQDRVFAYIERIMAYAGEHSLVESAENRMRELEDLKATVLKLRAALEKWKAYFQANNAKTDDEKEMQGEQFTDAWFNMETALTITTTDSAWLPQLRHTLGLLRAARSHIPESGISGSLLNQVDREIERLQKLIPRDECAQV